MLVANAPGGLLPTIRSRCRKLVLKPLADETVRGLLARYRPDLPEADAAALARLAQGSIGRALELEAAGGLDLYRALIPAHWPELANAPSVVAAFARLQLSPPRLRYLAFQAAHPPLDDARVRHALALLVDRRTIAKRVFHGLARPILWPIWPGGPVDGPEPAVPAFDPAKAGKLLDAAGWTDSDKNGIRDKDGTQLELVMIGGEEPEADGDAKDATGAAPETERDYFVEAARRVGVVIHVKTGGESWLEKRVREGDYDLVEVRWSGLSDADVTPLVAGDDPARPIQPAVDRVLDALGAAWDPAGRERLAPELAAALATSWPIAGIVADAPQGLVHHRLRGLRVFEGWIDLSALSFAPSDRAAGTRDLR
jgi:ABC-type transport system substrate-binding protein